MKNEDKVDSDMESLTSSFGGLRIEARGGQANSNLSGRRQLPQTNASMQWKPTENDTDLINGAFVGGFAPLTYAMMIETPLEQLESMIRIRLVTLINPIYPQLSGRIATVLMASGIWDCYCMLQNLSYFQAAVEHVVAQLSAD